MHRRAFISLIFNTPSAHASTFITNSILYSTSKHALPFCPHSRKQLCRKEGCASLSQILAGLTIRTKLAHSRHSRSLAKKKHPPWSQKPARTERIVSVPLEMQWNPFGSQWFLLKKGPLARNTQCSNRGALPLQLGLYHRYLYIVPRKKGKKGPKNRNTLLPTLQHPHYIRCIFLVSLPLLWSTLPLLSPTAPLSF